MNTERKLSALLHELQHAKSPLAQARVLARAWRTLRELSPTDRRLLARHTGFDGAEEVLEGLSRKGGLAPAMLLRVLANARATDEVAVSQLLESFRDPERRDEAISRSAELASELLAEPDNGSPADEVPEEVGEALEELQAVEEAIAETPEEALAALNAIEPEHDVVPEPVFESAPEIVATPEPEETQPEAEPDPPPPPPPPVVDWSRWHSAPELARPAPMPRPVLRPSASDAGSRRFEARAVMGAMGAAQSTFSQLRVLHRELSGFKGSSLDTLGELLSTFPDGWARRRALCALFENGIPGDTDGALELVACLERELDRRWCLAILARRGELRGAALTRALEMVDSSHGKKRLKAMAR